MNPLISADSLLTTLNEAKPVLIDVTWNLSAPAGAPKPAPGRDAYDAGHLPGAHLSTSTPSWPVHPATAGVIRCPRQQSLRRHCAGPACPMAPR